MHTFLNWITQKVTCTFIGKIGQSFNNFRSFHTLFKSVLTITLNFSCWCSPKQNEIRYLLIYWFIYKPVANPSVWVKSSHRTVQCHNVYPSNIPDLQIRIHSWYTHQYSRVLIQNMHTSVKCYTTGFQMLWLQWTSHLPFPWTLIITGLEPWKLNANEGPFLRSGIVKEDFKEQKFKSVHWFLTCCNVCQWLTLCVAQQ